MSINIGEIREQVKPCLLVEYISPHEFMPFVVVQNRVMGHRCGYVCIPEDHPFRDKNEIEKYDIRVHGGITFSDEIGAFGYMIGFDCAHSGDKSDLSLMSKELRKAMKETKLSKMLECGNGRSAAYVKGECMRLRDQLIAVYRGELVKGEYEDE